MNDPRSKKLTPLQDFFLRDYAQHVARDYVSDGFFFYRGADYQRAEKCFRDALTCDPNNYSAKRYVSLFDAVKHGKSEYDAALNERKAGDRGKAQEHFEEAKTCFQRALSMDSNYSPARSGLSMVFSSEGFDNLARGDYEGALTVFRTLFNFNPGFNTAYVPLIHLLMQKAKAALDRKEFEVAEQFLLEAVQVDKFNALPTQELVNLQISLHIQHALSKEDSPHEALVLLEKALAFDPANGEALLYSGMCYSELGQTRRVIECYQKSRDSEVNGHNMATEIERARKQASKNKRLLMFAEKSLKKREFDKAREAVNEILDISSEHSNARLMLAEIELAQEKYAQKEAERVTYTRKLRSNVGEAREMNVTHPDPRKRSRNGF